MEEKDLFFKTRAANFNIDKMELHLSVKNQWKNKSKVTADSDKYQQRIQIILDAIKFRECIKILDVGCGFGFQIIELAHLGAHCIGLDASEANVRIINQIRDDFGLNLRGIYGDGCNLPFNDETFDVVISRQFFEHVTDIDLAMREQIRVIVTGGRLIIEQSNLFSPLVLFDLLIKYQFRTRGKYGGIKWLFNKSKVRENIYGSGWSGKDEDIHSSLWWRRKMKQLPNLKIEEFTSSTLKTRQGFFRLLAPLIGNIFIVAVKERK